MLLGVSCVFAACGGHKHTFSDEWVNTDPETHWHPATCEHTDVRGDEAKHSIVGGECTVCKYKAIEVTEDDSQAVTTLVYKNTRMQLLTDSLVRIEDKTNGKFEDRASYTVLNRTDFGEKVSYSVEKTETGYNIVTDCYTVVIPENGTADDVYIVNSAGKTLFEYMGATGSNVWLPSPSDELKSWYFTDSPRIIPSDNGYSPTDVDNDLQGWEFQKNATDIYAFVPQGDYRTFTSDFVALTGRSEMVALKYLGFWDSRYYAYNENTALQQIEDYKSRGYAIDVFVVDTDWRSTSGGWGYDVNTALFPDMERFLQRAHEAGANVVFNDHPQPVTGTDNLLDKEEVDYRTEKLTMLLAMGLDGWWYDRNWTVALNPISDEVSRYTTGMYAYQWITQKHLESITDVIVYAKRALILANVDGNENGAYGYASDLSAHRYTMQWTGDTSCGSDFLQQEIEGAVMAGAELGLPYISSDLGGHTGCPGMNEDVLKRREYMKLYDRWIQYGMLSAVSRLHYWACDGRGRMPWLYDATAQDVFKTYEDMRYRLLPLYYALSHENYETGLPVLRRLDINYKQYAESNRNDEYLLGDYILVAPISTSTGEDSRTVFLPDGVWIDVWTGTRYSGPVTINVTHGISTSPVFVREGALVALARNMLNVDEKDWSEMTLDVYPSADYSAETTVYEDDTQTVAYKDGKFRTTDIAMNCNGNTLTVNIGKANGSFSGDRAFAQRKWNVRLHTNPGWGEITGIKVNGAAVDPQTLDKLAYADGARPFAYTGGSLDGDVAVFSIDTDVDKAYVIEIVYASTAASSVNESYNDAAVSYTLKIEGSMGDEVDLTECGVTDWVAYGHFAGTEIDRKANGPELFSNVSTFLGSDVTNYKPAYKSDGLIYRYYADGAQRYASDGGGYYASVCTGFRFSVKTTGAKEKVVLYLGGSKTLAKLTVRDRAGNARTVNLGGLDNDDFAYIVTVECEAGEASELYFEYQAQCGKFQKRGGTAGQIDNVASRVDLYCGYVAPIE